ncbi:MAG TPA: hypothetical protein VHP58_01910 [Alphaproteobacteria bacterium]|nr:hypothetical protein [Alphaproteobacteria bacterium]
MTNAAYDMSFEQRLARIDLSKVMAEVAEEHGLNAAEAARAEDLYRKFLTLKGNQPQLELVPPRIADFVWHAHITHTRQYVADCELLFGSYLHHNGDATDTEEKYFGVTVPSYKGHFGIDLNQMAVGGGTFYGASDCSG